MWTIRLGLDGAYKYKHLSKNSISMGPKIDTLVALVSEFTSPLCYCSLIFCVDFLQFSDNLSCGLSGPFLQITFIISEFIFAGS